MRSSVVERFPDKKEVHSPILCAPTLTLDHNMAYELQLRSLGRLPNQYAEKSNHIQVSYDPHVLILSHI